MKKIIIIAIVVWLHSGELGWALDCYPIQMSLVKSTQIVHEDNSICGLKVNIPYGYNETVSGMDFGFVGGTNEITGIQANIFANINRDVLGSGLLCCHLH